jgi:hypothetical protein
MKPEIAIIKRQLYTFRGKTFPSDADTISRLNYALALNHAPDRYVKAEPKKVKA